MRETRLPPESFESFYSCLAERFSIGRSKVYRLVEIESVVESSMIRLGKRDHKLASSLIKSIHTDACFLQLVRRKERNELRQQIRLCLEQLGSRLTHRFLEGWSISTWNAVPGLDGPRMLIIDRVRVMILVVPAESRETHTNIDPGIGHAGDIGLDVPE